MNMDVRIPLSLKDLHILVRKARLRIVSHPALEVRASGASGTRVTWSGMTSQASAAKLPVGLPSMLNSVVTRGRISLTSEYLMCLSSGLGWTVMPSAPNFSQSSAALVTSGMFPPRALRRVAILFMFTLSLVMATKVTISA